jgi:hypothetical protein
VSENKSIDDLTREWSMARFDIEQAWKSLEKVRTSLPYREAEYLRAVQAEREAWEALNAERAKWAASE